MLRPPQQDSTKRCRVSLVVLDFEGTLTHPEAHAAVFHEGSGRELAS